MTVRFAPDIAAMRRTGKGGAGPPFRNPPRGATLVVEGNNSNGRDKPGLGAGQR
jgi:hypothetical protein